jgi:prepilin-type processing-associated H-X9-DG protein
MEMAWENMQLEKLDAGNCGLRAGAPSARWGFVLAELLVVIITLALLAGLMVPALASAGRKQRSAQCNGNLGRSGRAFESYAGDHSGHIMQRYYGIDSQGVEIGYDELLFPYVPGACTLTNRVKCFTCPGQQQIDYPHVPGYGMNWYYDNVRLADIPRPADIILAAEARGPRGAGSHRADRNSNFPGELDAGRHAGRANYLFCDGHVESLSWSQTLSPTDRWGSNQNPAVTNCTSRCP